MSFLRYQEYKDSGVEWLGEVPGHWNLKRLDRLFYERKEEPGKEAGLVSAFISGEVTLRSNRPDQIIKSSGEEHGYKKVCRGDLVISGMNAHLGGLGISDSDGKASPVYIVLVGVEITNETYISYLLRHYATSGYLGSLVNTIRYNSADMKYSDVKMMLVICPPILEQSIISIFLDREVGKIDALVTEQEKLIGTLKEKRKAVISHAVTKGLDPTKPMRDSGTEWLGMIPGHWELKRLRYITRLNPSKSELSMIDRDAEVSFLPMEAIREDGGLRLDTVRPIYEVDKGYTYFRENDVTVAKITPCFENGKGAVMRNLTNGIGFGTTELIVVRPHVGKVLSEFLKWIFSSVFFLKLGESAMYGAGGQKRVPESFIRDFPVALPSLSEQRSIVDFLDQETAKIDTLISEAQRAIELLKERRGALISAAVTGKIDVRGLVSQGQEAKQEVTV